MLPPAGRAGAAGRPRPLPQRAPRARCGRRSRTRCSAGSRRRHSQSTTICRHRPPPQPRPRPRQPAAPARIALRLASGWFAGTDEPHRIVHQVDAVEVRAEQVRRPGMLVVEHHRKVEVAALQRGHGRRAAHPRRGSAPPPDAVRWNRETASVTSVAPALGKLARRTRPPRSPAIAASSRSASASWAKITSARATSGSARVGQPHPARAPLQQGRAGLTLERRDLLADRRLGVVERVRRRGERSEAGDLAQHSQPAERRALAAAYRNDPNSYLR